MGFGMAFRDMAITTWALMVSIRLYLWLTWRGEFFTDIDVFYIAVVFGIMLTNIKIFSGGYDQPNKS